jgi:protein arginine kinase activator
MKCEICSAAEANVHFKHMNGGEMKEIFVCEKCAAEKGLSWKTPQSLSQFLFGAHPGPSGGDPAPSGRVCPACRMAQEEFRKSSRLGCAVCYETFAEELRPLLLSMHYGSRHKGRTPRRRQTEAELWRLRHDLEAAVASQRFEEAATLRDRIKELDSRAAASRGRDQGCAVC